MKKHLSTIVTVLALVIAVVSQFRISNLQSEMQRMENRLNNSISMMQSNQSAAISHMQDLMEQESSILTHTDFSLGEMNLANKSFLGNNAKEEPAPSPNSGTQVNGTETFYHMVDRAFDIPFGSTLELIAEVVDGNGLRYRTVLEYWAVNEMGEPMDDAYLGLRDLFEQILDTDGNILYEVDEADYR